MNNGCNWRNKKEMLKNKLKIKVKKNTSRVINNGVLRIFQYISPVVYYRRLSEAFSERERSRRPDIQIKAGN
jgi:hypothetical protein